MSEARVPNFIDADRLVGITEFLCRRVRGQEESLRVVGEAVQRAEMGMAPVGRPMASFLFLGPTGVGKTETALALSEFLYGTEKALKRFDMAEYQTKSAVEQLIGDRSSAGLMGHAVDDLMARNGGGILLFDEIEKADKDLSTVFLSALDAGHITMATGESKRMDHFYFIFTSNLGSAEAIRMQRLPQKTIERRVLDAAQKWFRPELFARFQERLVFNRLSFDIQREIADGLLARKVRELRASYGMTLRYTPDVVSALMDIGYTKLLGARPMRGAVEREIGNAVTKYILSGGNSSGAVLIAFDPSNGFTANRDEEHLKVFN